MAEQRLIDANALDFTLVDEYITDKSQTAALTGKGRCIFNAAIDIARCRVADAETIDVVPVVHGRWVYNPGGYIPYCNQCGMPQDVPTNYCHDCGAKMDAKKDLLSEFSANVASMTDNDVRASIQNAERLTAGCAREEE